MGAKRYSFWVSTQGTVSSYGSISGDVQALGWRALRQTGFLTERVRFWSSKSSGEDSVVGRGRPFSPLRLGPATTPLESLRRAWDDSRGAWDYVGECGWLRSHTPVVGEFREGSKRNVMTNADGVLLF